MESLHRQVLPFILRRLKEDVLQDLPPKIIQDYYCELSPLQVMWGRCFVTWSFINYLIILDDVRIELWILRFQTQLYEDFAKSRAKQGVEDSVTLLESTDNKERKSAGATHVFQVCVTILLLVLIIKNNNWYSYSHI